MTGNQSFETKLGRALLATIGGDAIIRAKETRGNNESSIKTALRAAGHATIQIIIPDAYNAMLQQADTKKEKNMRNLNTFLIGTFDATLLRLISMTWDIGSGNHELFVAGLIMRAIATAVSTYITFDGRRTDQLSDQT